MTLDSPNDGETGDLLRATEWGKTSLGPIDTWPISLKTMVRAMLSTRQATCIFWGADLVNLYNDAFIPILGEKHPRAMGQSARDVWSDAWPVVGELLNGVVSEGKAVLFEEMLIPIVRRGQLEDAWWNYSYSPVFDDGGKVIGILVVATETTAGVIGRKALEAAKIEAEAANRAKDEFLATISHELRTPLNAILGWSRLLENDRDPERLEKGLTVIRRNASAQAKLIDDILDVARIITGKVVVELRHVHVSKVIESAVESIRPAAMSKRLRLTVTSGADVDLVADEERLQQIVWNLLANAVKFTPPDGEIRITAAKDEAASAVLIQVSDTGKGIAPQFLPHVFDRFRQADVSTTKRYGGLGLGLAIVRHLVELHGGTVTARSEGEGRGATFEIALPIRAVHSLSQEKPSASKLEDGEVSVASTRSRGAPDQSLVGVHALVVDDVRDARELVAAALQEAGATVSEASSSVEAMEIVQANEKQHQPIAVVVSDIGMPFEDGYTLIQRLRSAEAPAIRDVPALALTAYARAEDRTRAIAAGFQQHAAKPVDPKTLVRIVTSLIRLSN